MKEISDKKKKGKEVKKGRKWEDEFSNGNEDDYNIGPKTDKTSSSSSSLSGSSQKVETVNLRGSDFNIEDNSFFFNEEDDNDDEEDDNSGAGGFMSIFNGMSGKTLSEESLSPVLTKFKEHLEDRNVASEVAGKLCDSVKQTLLGQKLGTFASVTKAVREALGNSLRQVLTPDRPVDILRDISAHKKARPGAPFTIVFMGANGVGKSTNLAKIGSWLRCAGQKVMFAACDTFRSGAIEQLKVHSQRLGIELFEAGYGKDDTAIAVDAIEHAKAEGIDVVLIDTAGRMQDKEPLMRAISKLVNTVQPNLALYVGEALVGNDAVDQLTRFNQALLNVSADIVTPRKIDGIVLTKFDTVDDKVGSAVTMVYTTRVPIVFIGTGQQYTDIKKLQVSTIVHTLLK